MTKAAQDIFDLAMHLDEEQRSELAERLYETLQPRTDHAYEEAWTAEIQRRLDDIDSGIVKTIPAEEVIRRMKQRLDKHVQES